MIWKDKREVYMMANMHNPLPEGNFCDEHMNAVKPSIVEDYGRNMGSVDKADRMAAIPLPNAHGNGQRNFLSSPEHNHSEKLYLAFILWWGKNYT
jgi:hypothetical protein